MWALENQEIPANEVIAGCPRSQTTCGSVVARSIGAEDNDNQLLLSSEHGISVDSSNENLTYVEATAAVVSDTNAANAAQASVVAESAANDSSKNDEDNDMAVRIEQHE